MSKKFVSLDRLSAFLTQMKKLIPTVNNPTITIKQAGSQKGAFTLNQSGNATIELTDNNTIYGTGTASTAGTTKLYTGTGTATDGTMTQAAITELVGDVESLLASI